MSRKQTPRKWGNDMIFSESSTVAYNLYSHNRGNKECQLYSWYFIDETRTDRELRYHVHLQEIITQVTWLHMSRMQRGMLSGSTPPRMITITAFGVPHWNISILLKSQCRFWYVHDICWIKHCCLRLYSYNVGNKEYQ